MEGLGFGVPGETHAQPRAFDQLAATASSKPSMSFQATEPETGSRNTTWFADPSPHTLSHRSGTRSPISNPRLEMVISPR